MHSLLLQSDFVDDSRETVMTDAEPTANLQPPPELWALSNAQPNEDGLAVDPLFDNLDPFGISYWNAFAGGQGPDGRLWGSSAGLNDSIFDGMDGGF